MARRSRDKGARFERFVASAFAARFNRKIRRVPLSGGLDIKCDLYDPENDDFPFFIECKYRESYRWSTLWDHGSPLFDVFLRTQKQASESYLKEKYIGGPHPLVVFKGGDFNAPMVMFTVDAFCSFFTDAAALSVCLRVNHGNRALRIALLHEFLDKVRVSNLRERPKNTTTAQEDDGEY